MGEGVCWFVFFSGSEMRVDCHFAVVVVKQAIVTFALSLVDALLFVHYAAVLLLEIRQLPPRYYLHVIRSPDGISKGYPIGAVSVPRRGLHQFQSNWIDGNRWFTTDFSMFSG